MKTVMKTFMVGENPRNLPAAQTAVSELNQSRSEGLSQVVGFIVPIMKGFTMPSSVRRPTDGGNSLLGVVSHRRRQSMVAAEYGSSPEVAGHTGAGVGLYSPRSAEAVH
jgi:hypothetical protein